MRQFTYGKLVSGLAAHQISLVNRFWPIESLTQAWTIGFCWLIMTVIFEFGFGHYVAGHDWEQLFADYNFFKGRVWLFFLIWVTALPLVVFKLASKAA